MDQLKTDMLHRVGLLLFPDYQLLDAAGPMAVFESAIIEGRPVYEICLLSAAGGAIRSSGGAILETMRPEEAGIIDTALVCGGLGALNAAVEPSVADFLVKRARSGHRIGSICTGAFVLASLGLLQGKRVTTHWRFATELARRYPGLNVDADSIWVRDGSLWTSAGVSAGMDLALAFVTEDLGQDMARRIAQELVVYYRRPGGQSQFSTLLKVSHTDGRFASLLGWIREHLDQPLHVERLAGQVSMSPRNFSRAFKMETGVTPAKAVEQMRLEVAREWVERGTHSIVHIAVATGFGGADRMRNAFVRAFGVPPQAIRRTF
ncbi:MAG: GlxA family transcriptional regulator [Pseudomonadota bacterium]